MCEVLDFESKKYIKDNPDALGCLTCFYVKTDEDKFPCIECVNNYPSKWKLRNELRADSSIT